MQTRQNVLLENGVWNSQLNAIKTWACFNSHYAQNYGLFIDKERNEYSAGVKQLWSIKDQSCKKIKNRPRLPDVEAETEAKEYNKIRLRKKTKGEMAK